MLRVNPGKVVVIRKGGAGAAAHAVVSVTGLVRSGRLTGRQADVLTDAVRRHQPVVIGGFMQSDLTTAHRDRPVQEAQHMDSTARKEALHDG